MIQTNTLHHTGHTQSHVQCSFLALIKPFVVLIKPSVALIKPFVALFKPPVVLSYVTK